MPSLLQLNGNLVGTAYSFFLKYSSIPDVLVMGLSYADRILSDLEKKLGGTVIIQVAIIREWGAVGNCVQLFYFLYALGQGNPPCGAVYMYVSNC